MFPFPVMWDKIAAKTGDDVALDLTQVQRSLLIAVIMNIQAIGESAPTTLNIGDDSDNFDAVISDLMSKLSGA